jgi:hypothetical protein
LQSFSSPMDALASLRTVLMSACSVHSACHY